MNVRQLIELLEGYGDHLEVLLNTGQGGEEPLSGECEMSLDLDHNNITINGDGNLVINL